MSTFTREDVELLREGSGVYAQCPFRLRVKLYDLANKIEATLGLEEVRRYRDTLSTEGAPHAQQGTEGQTEAASAPEAG